MDKVFNVVGLHVSPTGENYLLVGFNFQEGFESGREAIRHALGASPNAAVRALSTVFYRADEVCAGITDKESDFSPLPETWNEFMDSFEEVAAESEAA